MAGNRRGGVMRWSLWCAMLASIPASAADVGGWFADQQKASAQAASGQAAQSCSQVIARAAVETTAVGAYQAANCYLQADPPDLVAAKAWLTRSAELDFLPAQRLLRALLVAEAGAHSPARHCHDLGDARQICHGGAPAAPVATAPMNRP